MVASWSSHARTKPRFLSFPDLRMRTERLFSYGTLQQEDVQRATFGRLLEGAPDALVGFARQMLEIADPDVLAKSGKSFHPIVVHTADPPTAWQGRCSKLRLRSSALPMRTRLTIASVCAQRSRRDARPGCT